jgi:hypothetical protein
LEASVDAASKLFQNARVEYVEVLLAQRDMLEAKTVLIDTKRRQLAAVVNAYQALGGGNALAAPSQGGGGEACGVPTPVTVPDALNGRDARRPVDTLQLPPPRKLDEAP